MTKEQSSETHSMICKAKTRQDVTYNVKNPRRAGSFDDKVARQDFLKDKVATE